MKLVRAFYERYTARLGNAAYHSFDDIEATLRSGGFLNRTLDALWPRPRPEQLVRRLLDEPRAARSRRGRHPRRGRATPPPVGPRPGLERRRPAAPRRGARAARGRRPGPRPRDRRRGAGPDADAAAHARAALDGAVTVLGDIAQSSGPISYSGWDELVRYLGTEGVAGGRGAAPRLPCAAQRCMELALPLLPLIAPDVAAADRLPRGRRAAPFRACGARAPRRRRGARGRPEALRDGRTALIAPATLMAELEPLLPRPGRRSTSSRLRSRR